MLTTTWCNLPCHPRQVGRAGVSSWTPIFPTPMSARSSRAVSSTARPGAHCCCSHWASESEARVATAHSSRKLARYRSKRDFTRTHEPSGHAAGVQPSPQLRYVIQKHEARRLHFDLRLELDGVFKSWA